MSQNHNVGGFEVFLRSLYNQMHKNGTEKGMEEIHRMADERWKTLSAADKKIYNDYAEQQRQQLGLEMPAAGGVTISTAESSSGRKRKRGGKGKQEKDPNQPKRATTAFFFFAQDERSKVKAEHPEFKVTEISKELGRMWGAMTQEAKEKYLSQAEQDKLRYAIEKEAYEKSKQTGVVAQEVSGEDED